ncbi:MAG TPA: lysophospholipid acyltransferase family protein [Gemmatimonadaceae bacterium]|nr:lysophospholipid acyltransferase family protein [Gemmatimonadaceae bacterium]
MRRPILNSLGALGLRLLGWRVTGAFPDRSKFVIIVAPHTSNWDFVVGFLAYLATGIDAAWFGKHSIFRWPFGPILRSFGGIPIERRSSHNVVEQSIAEFNRRQQFVLALAPEGTRRRVASWRSGFYYIALGAAVPIVTVSLDFAHRELLVGPAFTLTGDYAADLTRLATRFSDIRGRNPELYEPVPQPNA